MTKIIQCPVCESELSSETAKFKPMGDGSFKMRCGLCHHTWIAQPNDFYDPPTAKVPTDPPVVKA